MDYGESIYSLPLWDRNYTSVNKSSINKQKFTLNKKNPIIRSVYNSYKNDNKQITLKDNKVFNNLILAQSLSNMNDLETYFLNKTGENMQAKYFNKSINSLENVVSFDAEPELKDAKKSQSNYHITMNLKANPLIAPPRIIIDKTTYDETEAYSSLNEEIMNRYKNNEASNDIPEIEEDLNKSVFDLTEADNLNIQIDANYSRSALLSNHISNLDKGSSVIKLDIRNSSENQTVNKLDASNQLFIKSIEQSKKPQQIINQIQKTKKNTVDFDLQLIGMQIKSKTSLDQLKSQIIDMKANEIPVQHLNIDYQNKERSRARLIETNKLTNESKEGKANFKEILKQDTEIPKKKQIRVSNKRIQTDNQEEECFDFPDAIKSRSRGRPIEEDENVATKTKLNKKISVYSGNNSYKIKVKGKENIVPRSKIQNENQFTREIKINQNREPIEEKTSKFFKKRLMKDAPKGSLQQAIKVEKEEEEIVGPLPPDEIDHMYSNSMINVDSVSEKVNLTLSDGMAQLVLKIRYERIVPIKDSDDTFRKTSVLVTRVIDVDLMATEERRQIYQNVVENHSNGRLNNKYTFELYKAFVDMAEEDNGFGMNQEHLSIQKQVEEEKLLDLRRKGKVGSVSGGDFDLLLGPNKISDIDEPDLSKNIPRHNLMSNSNDFFHRTELISQIEPINYNSGRENFLSVKRYASTGELDDLMANQTQNNYVTKAQINIPVSSKVRNPFSDQTFKPYLNSQQSRLKSIDDTWIKYSYNNERYTRPRLGNRFNTNKYLKTGTGKVDMEPVNDYRKNYIAYFGLNARGGRGVDDFKMGDYDFWRTIDFKKLSNLKPYSSKIVNNEGEDNSRQTRMEAYEKIGKEDFMIAKYNKKDSNYEKVLNNQSILKTIIEPYNSYEFKSYRNESYNPSLFNMNNNNTYSREKPEYNPNNYNNESIKSNKIEEEMKNFSKSSNPLYFYNNKYSYNITKKQNSNAN